VWHFEREDLTPLARETAGAALEIGERLPGKLESLLETAPQRPRIPILLKGRKRSLLKHGLHAVFGFPLYAEGKLQAVLEFFSDTPHPPEKNLIQVVQSIGEQLGRLLERREGQVQHRQAVAMANALNLATIHAEALEATLDALNSGVYLADREGRIAYMNREAKRQADTRSIVRVTNGRLTPIDHKASLTLTRAIEKAVGEESDPPTSGFTIALPGVNNAGLIATILPLARGEPASPRRGTAMAAIFVQDPIIMPSPAGDAFAGLYGLTTSELRVLLAMAPGLSAKEAAETLGISESTAKTHLKHIHSKTGTSKQTELIRLFMSVIPPVSAPPDLDKM
jgi:DNA-binding CsgD family transcriptional regulator/PAS domain-containing protein